MKVNEILLNDFDGGRIGKEGKFFTKWKQSTNSSCTQIIQYVSCEPSTFPATKITNLSL